jgi:hypothetical protein
MLIAPRRDEIPERCRLNTARSTEPPLCDCTPVRGMYIVQPLMIIRITSNIFFFFPAFYKKQEKRRSSRITED